MREVALPSGAVLRVAPSPFPIAKALYHAVLKEARGIDFADGNKELPSVFLELFCAGFSSPEIDRALFECMKRCTYNHGGKGDLKIDADTFEPEHAREDYMTVCMEVAKENIGPFVKSLYAEFRQALSMLESIQK